ncbi:MAG TPA: thaumatin family protein [Polyangiaceae bacterium]
MRITPNRLFLFAVLLDLVSACSDADGGAGAPNANGGSSQAASTSETALGGAPTAVGGSTSMIGGTTSTSAGTKTSAGGTTSTSAGTKTSAGTSTGGTSAGTKTSAAGNTSLPTSAADCRQEGDGKTTLVFVNGCSKSVTYRGSDIPGGTIAAGAFACVDVGTSTEAISSKRYWGWIGADPGAERHSLAEFTFNTDFYDMDWYNISYVDAYNLPLAILPAARPKCRQLSCPEDFLSTCPAAGQYRDADGNLAACVSPNRDDPKNPVALLFEQCDDAYAWSGDDQNGTDKSPMIGCEVEDFDIVFCPGAT